MHTLIESLTTRGGPVDQARELATIVGARPYRVFLAWARWPEGEIGQGRELGPSRWEITPRPKVTGYAAISRNPTVIGVIPTGTVRVEEAPLWIPREAMKGHVWPEPGKHCAMLAGPEKGIEFWYEIEVDERDPSAKKERFRLSAEPERDEENAQWILVLERQATQDR